MLQVDASVVADIILRPEAFISAYGALADSTSASAYVSSQLGTSFASLSDAGGMVTYACVVAYNVAPAGDPSLNPMDATLQQLLTAPALASGHSCKLATLLSLLGNPQLIPPDAPAGSPAKASIHFLVWAENVPLNTGVHCQLVVSNVLDTAYLLLDPMYAYALRLPYATAGPQADLSVIENAAVLLQTPLAQENLAVLDPAGTAAVPQMLQTLISGVLGPQYLDVDASDGSEDWDAQIAIVIDNMG